MGAMSQTTGTMTPGRNATADRAIDVLLLFDERSPVLSAVEVARRLNMSRSTTYRYLQSLRSYELLEEDDEHGGFRLGPRVFELARVARKGLGLSEIALPVMRELGAQVDEAVLLTRRSGALVVCVERVESSHPIRLSYERGHLLPPHAGASAKVLLAFTDPAEVDEVLGSGKLDRFTDATVSDPRRLREQLAVIRAEGYAISDGEVDIGVRGIAAPILTPDRRAAAGLSVAGPAFRLTDERLPEVIAAVRAAATKISERLAEVTA
jgi:DNA-binding IclR family transcriptional regulator